MKTIIILLLIHVTIYSQSYIEDLRSGNNSRIISALDEIEFFKHEDAIPHIKDQLQKFTPMTQFVALQILSEFEDPEVEALALSYYDRSDEFEKKSEEFFMRSIQAKLLANRILFRYNNFSHSDIVLQSEAFEFPDQLPLLYNYIIFNYEPHFVNANQRLLYYIENKLGNQSNRMWAIAILEKLIKNNRENDYDTHLLLTNLYATEINSSMRIGLFYGITSITSPDVKEFLISMIPNEELLTLKFKMLDSLLSMFGSPSDLMYVKDYLPNISDTVYYDLVIYLLRDFEPPQPANSKYIDDINQIIEYSKQLFNYRWIKNDSDYEALLHEFKRSRQLIQENQIDDKLCNSLRQNEEVVLQYYAEEKITIEGYKYLYFLTKYLIEKLPPGLHCEAK